MKKHWIMMLIVVVLCLAVSIAASNALGAKLKLGIKKNNLPEEASLVIMTSGGTTGTWEVHVTQHADGTLGTATTQNVSSQSTHGNYVSKNGTLYINTFLSSPGGQYGLLTYQKDGSGTWQQTGFESATISLSNVITNAGALIDSTAGTGTTVSDTIAPIASAASAIPTAPVPLGMFCSTDLMTKYEDPDNGVLVIGDIATGLVYFYNMHTKGWNAVLGATGTVCDMSFRESQNNDEAWTSGHTNNVYHFTQAQNAKYGIQPALDAPGSKLAVATLGHQNRTFTLDGEEYVVWSDGSAGDLVFIKTKDNTDAGRLHAVNGENHDVSLNMAGDGSSATGVINAVVPNFVDGSVTGIQVRHKITGDASSGLELDPAIVVKNTVPGTNTAADLCSMDIVSSNGEWVRN